MLKVLGSRPYFFKILSILTVVALLGGIFFFYIWHLGTLTPGFSQAESDAIDDSSSFKKIVDNPVFAPHKLLQFTFQSMNESGAFWMRLVSVLFALAFLVFFFGLLRLWFGKLVSVLGTLLLAGTPPLIIIARSATADVLFLAPISVIASFVWLTRTDKKNLAWFCLIFFAALSFYIPGMIIFVALTLIMLRKALIRTMRLIKPWVLVLSLGLALVTISPLMIASLNDSSILRSIFFIPDNWAGTTETIKSILWSGLALVGKTREHYPFIVDRLPLLSGIQMILIIFGLYALSSRARKELYLILIVITIGIVAAGLNNNPAFLISTLPVLGILAATGLRYLYKEWRDVFPINPLPRALAISLMGAIVAVHLLYGARYALIAWPNTEATRNTYNVLK